jgi:hypothetical protein
MSSKYPLTEDEGAGEWGAVVKVKATVDVHVNFVQFLGTNFYRHRNFLQFLGTEYLSDRYCILLAHTYVECV